MILELKPHLKKYISTYLEDFSNNNKPIENTEVFKRYLVQENENEALCCKLENEIGTLRGKAVLDIGCGAGGRSVAIALKGARVFGIEPILDGVKAAEIRAANYPQIKTDFLIGKWEELPFGNDSFDLVTSFYALEHIKNIDHAILEVRRILKKGGVFYCEVANSFFPREDHYGIFWFPLMPRWFAECYLKMRGRNSRGLDNFNYIIKRSIVDRLNKYGFSEIKDLNITYIKKKIYNAELIKNLNLHRLANCLKWMGLRRLVVFLIVKFNLYPALHLVSVKID